MFAELCATKKFRHDNELFECVRIFDELGFLYDDISITEENTEASDVLNIRFRIKRHYMTPPYSNQL